MGIGGIIVNVCIVVVYPVFSTVLAGMRTIFMQHTDHSHHQMPSQMPHISAILYTC